MAQRSIVVSPVEEAFRDHMSEQPEECSCALCEAALEHGGYLDDEGGLHMAVQPCSGCIAEITRQAHEQLCSVLCDPAGHVCCQGSPEGRRLIQEALGWIAPEKKKEASA